MLFTLNQTLTGLPSSGRLVLPTGFTVHGVEIFGADGRGYFYKSDEIRQLSNPFNNLYYVATGSVWANYPRQVRWQVILENTVALGKYQLHVDAFYRQKSILYWDKSEVNPTIFVGGTKFYLPLLLKDTMPL